jgi:hypothetical protein
MSLNKDPEKASGGDTLTYFANLDNLEENASCKKLLPFINMKAKSVR